MSQRITAPSGTKDVLPSEVGVWQLIENTAREVSKLFGFQEIRFPTFEYTELFTRGVGDTTDIVQKEMYTFTDKGGRSITLRPEGTASVVRAIIENSLIQAGLPIKVFYIVPNFRYEKPQKGRLREHHQFGVECFGPEGPGADVEVILLGDTLLKKLGIKSVELEINSIGCSECRPNYHSALRDYFAKNMGNLCETCKDRYDRNPMRILDCKEKSCREIAEGGPIITDYLCSDCAEHFEGVKDGLTDSNIKYRVNPRIVRGLDYYTRTVFEFISTGVGTQGTVLGGGRYDKLVSELGGIPTPGLGFGSGIERLILAMEESGSMPDTSVGPDLFVVAVDDDVKSVAADLTLGLRNLGIAVEHDLMGRSLKAQMKYSSRINASYVIVIGSNEISAGEVMLRDMSEGKEYSTAMNAKDIARLILEMKEAKG